MKMPDITIKNAIPEDNSQLIELSKQCPMDGDIKAYIDRNPDFSKIYQIFDNPILLVSKSQKEIAGCLGATHQDVIVNNSIYEMAAWGDFKVSPSYRGTRVAIDMLEELYNIELQSNTKFAVVSILRGNKKSLSFTKGKGKIPKAQALDDYVFYSILPFGKKKINKDYKIANANENNLDEMALLYNHYYEQYNLSPRYTIDSLQELIKNLPGLKLSDFLLVRKNRKLVACLARWDQQRLQRYVVTEFSGKIKLLTTSYTLLKPFFEMPAAPQKGNTLRFVFLSFLALRNNDRHAFDNLIKACHNSLIGQNYAFYNICLREKDPLGNMLKKYISTKVYTHNFAFSTTYNKNITDFKLTQKPVHIEYSTFI
ncbi:MAG: hypothetical protein C0594_11975 [Marinilabiliales bacterium]|nr:MAG: hypothetical protein C0594_11975 [Marinilabiliales bacterium]